MEIIEEQTDNNMNKNSRTPKALIHGPKLEKCPAGYKKLGSRSNICKKVYN
jgi:hypothetical protein